MRGPARAVRFVNVHVAWNGSLDVCKAQAAQVRPVQPSLTDGSYSG